MRQDWTVPRDSSPIATPEGWYGGEVCHTGGGLYQRIWRRDLPDHDELQGLQVRYNMELQVDGPAPVAVQPDGYQALIDDEDLRVEPEWNADMGFARAAREIMKRLNERY